MSPNKSASSVCLLNLNKDITEPFVCDRILDSKHQSTKWRLKIFHQQQRLNLLEIFKDLVFQLPISLT